MTFSQKDLYPLTYTMVWILWNVHLWFIRTTHSSIRLSLKSNLYCLISTVFWKYVGRPPQVSVDHNTLGTSEGRPTKTIGIAEAIGATGCKNFSSATPKIRSCPYCSFTTTIATQLSEHLRSHAVRELFPCPHCPFQCFQVESIRAHIRTHTGEKPFGCAYCSYRSAQKGNMKRHVLKHHT